MTEPGRDGTPYFPAHHRTSQIEAVQLVRDLRAAGGDELLIRRYDEGTGTAGPAATRLRRILGPDFYVVRRRNEIFARARKVGEPPLKLRKIRTGTEWMTMGQAAAELGITQQWLRIAYVKRGHLPKYRFGQRVVVKRSDVEAVKSMPHAGGAWAAAAKIAKMG